MPVSTLDPKTALIVIDLQKGIVAMPTANPIGPILAHARQLSEAVRRRGGPVVMVNVDARPPGRAEQSRPGQQLPPGFADFIPELMPQATDHIVTKKSPGAFTKTDLESYLRGQGVTQVIIIGVSTSVGVESTARQAFDLGFNVTFASDAMTDMDPECHAHSLTKIFPRIGETGTTEEILAKLNPAH